METDRNYEDSVERELQLWKRRLFKRPGLIERSTKKFSGWTNAIIPRKAHQILTVAVKGMVHASLFTAKYLPGNPLVISGSLREMDDKAKSVISTYKKLASAEGAGTGAGGIMLGLADFPALLAIKMKMLFELACCYGYRPDSEKERVFLLHIFQLAFSDYQHRLNVFEQIEHWDQQKNPVLSGESYYGKIDWREFQQQYRDSIDFRKMLQLIPGIGAVVGAWANYNLVDELGETAMNCYRLRIRAKNRV